MSTNPPVSESDSKFWMDRWVDKNLDFINAQPHEEILVKMFTDARADGLTRIEINPQLGKFAGAATKRCEPWATWQSWGPYHLFIIISK